MRDCGGHWYSLRIRPFRTKDNKIEGAALALVDIDELKRGLEQMGEVVWDPFLALDGDLRVVKANAAFFEHFQVTREEIIPMATLELAITRSGLPPPALPWSIRGPSRSISGTAPKASICQAEPSFWPQADMFAVQAFRYGRSYALQFHPDVTSLMMHNGPCWAIFAWSCRERSRTPRTLPTARSTITARAPG